MKRADLTGQTFGWLTVDHFEKIITVGKNTKRTLWSCTCKCGNTAFATTQDLRQGKVVSCGCKKAYNAKDRIIDETGKIHGFLRVKEKAGSDENRRVLYRCECLLCGKETIVSGKALRRGTTKSCGCLKVENRKTLGKRTFKDLTGKTIGYLYVESRAENKYSQAGNQSTMWNCKCLLCGGKTVVAGTALWNGHTRSCGCLHMSYAEKDINDELIKLKINFYHDYSFDDLISPYSTMPLRFDFALLDDWGLVLALLEYQGIQHFQKFKDGFGDMQREITDPIKKEYCRNNSIPLYEIRYNEEIIPALHKILSMVYNTSYDNTVPSEQETA